MLNDEVRSASGLSVSTGGAEVDPNAPRYGEQAGIEHHPQITDYIPRRKRALIVVLTAGLGVAAAAEALSHFAEPIAASVAGLAAGDVRHQLAEGLAAWSSAVALLLCAALARIVYSLRRHRVDDTKGRYRVWRWVNWGATLLSVNAVVGAHSMASNLLHSATGWSLTTGGAEWWLAPAALVGGWIAVRTLLEISESRSAASIFMLGMACYLAAAAGALGLSPAVLGPWADVLTNSLPLAGHTFTLVGLMLFARYVVLDVQGLIDHAPKRAAKPKRQRKAKEQDDDAEIGAKPAVAAISARTTQSSRAQREEDESADEEDGEWSDEEDDDQSSAGRKLSKADRKRLRRQQRAA